MHRPVKTRTNSQGRALAKASRPSALKLSKSPASSKASPSPKKAKRDSYIDPDDDLLDDMAGLPSFCAACEKQIINPHATFLYCSEACRRKDGTYVTPSQDGGASPPPIFGGMELDDEPLPDIVPQKSPTAPGFPTIGGVSHADDDDVESSSHKSEAARYLSQFLTMGHSPSERRARGIYYRNKTTSSQGTLPSLSHTPSSVGSATSSYNSVSRTAPQKLTPWGHRHATARSFELAIPGSMSNSFSGRSTSSTETAFKVAEAEMTYEKRPMAPTPINSPCAGSLKQLFAHEAMIRPPTLPHNQSSSSLANLH